MKEEVILDVKVDQGSLITDLEKAKRSIVQIKNEQKELNKAYKEGNITLDEYVSESVRLDGILKKQQTTYNTTQKAVTGVKTQLDKLIDSNKKISKDLETTANKFGEAAKNINVAGVSVGDVTNRLTAFANPATAAVGFVTALGAAYANSTVGAKDLSFAQAQLGSALSIVNNQFASLISSAEDGEGLFSRLANDILNRISPGLAAISNIQALNIEKLEDLERDRLDILSENNRRLEENQELLTEVSDSQTTYAHKIANTARAVNNLRQNQEDLRNVLTEQLTILQAQQSIDPNNENLQTAIKLKEKELSLVDRDAAKRIAAIEKLESNLLDIENKRLAALEKIRREEDLRAQRKAESAATEVGGLLEAPTSGLLPEDDFILRSRQQLQKDIAKINEKQRIDQENYTNFYIQSKKAEVDAAIQLTAALAGVFQQGSDLQKVFGLTSIGIDTGKAIASLTAASEANPANALTFGGAGIAQYASGLIRILTNIAAAKNLLSQAAGGGDFVTKGPALLMVGDNPGGRERVTVEPLSGRGQTKVNGNLVRMAGGGTITSGDGGAVTASLTQETNAAIISANAIKRMPTPVVSWVEGERVGKRVRFKESITRT